MGNEQNWILGAFVALIGLGGLYLASGAPGGGGVYWAGLGISAVCLLFIFYMIKQAYDAPPGEGHGD
ncbi:MAG: hypothetical protein OEM59_06380 [Rhodospirillales bacterium]|nr:hypothetical protein [Rhodospirillales bacterium]